jgi:hypothetical protein
MYIISTRREDEDESMRFNGYNQRFEQGIISHISIFKVAQSLNAKLGETIDTAVASECPFGSVPALQQVLIE